MSARGSHAPSAPAQAAGRPAAVPPAAGDDAVRLRAFEEKKRRLVAEVRSAAAGVSLRKDTSNLFRDRLPSAAAKLDVRSFNRVLRVDPGRGWVETEGMTTYADLVDATLPRGVMPAVVPQLRSITLGGAVSGVGIESSSFRYGLVHETIEEMEILVGGGRIVTCTPDNEHRDLFYGFPNSYGTLGYALRLRARTVPVRPYVHLRHRRFSDARSCFAALGELCARDDVDFIDGTVFSGDEIYLTLGSFVDEAPFTSDYSYEKIYYRSIRERETDYLTTRDYIWRWDTDWFWCSKNLYAENPVVRRLLGPARLNSITYQRIMRWNARWGVTRAIDRALGLRSESVIQDVDIPLEHAAEFLEFFLREVPITPVWLCPIGHADPSARFDLYPLDPRRLYVNFGFWDVVKERARRPPDYYNRKVEAMVGELQGLKSLYSSVHYTPEEFWSIYDKELYERLKARYDPQGSFRDLYRKCALGE